MPGQPKRSVFDPDPPKVKGVPESQRAKSADSSDTTTTPKPDHEKGLIDSIKGLIASHASTSGNKQETSALDALEKGTADAPGNTTDY